MTENQKSVLDAWFGALLSVQDETGLDVSKIWQTADHRAALQIIGNEAYTSKTRSWDGSIVQSLGGAKTITNNNIRVDRDVNGARALCYVPYMATHAILRQQRDYVAFFAGSNE